ncbi:Prickle-like protein 2 [Blastocladiella emersonii ATCC 22665]|nr:Prickle-like protein 2 [Blastocladiella emersonii ATCC 22665]
MPAAVQLSDIRGIRDILLRDLAAVKDGSLGKIRGYCASCHNPIKEKETITYASGNPYHEEHFRCVACTSSLINCGFILTDGDTAPMCEPCYAATVLPKCAACAQPIRHEMLNIADKSYHPACLACARCKAGLAGQGVYDNGGALMCKPCFEYMLAPECERCKQKIAGANGKAEYLVINERKYHAACFSCYDCGARFEDMKAFTLGDKFLCRNDFLKQTAGSTPQGGS